MEVPITHIPDLSAAGARAMANGGEFLSTEQFCQELAGIDFREEGPRIRTYGVDMDPELMLGALVASDELEPITSSDGLISHVRENPSAHAADNSGSSRYFSLHTDGQYLPTVPEMAVLYCVDPGTSEIPTVFVDTKDILAILQRRDLLQQARGYEHVFRNKHGRDFVRPLIETKPGSDELVMNVALASPQCHLRPVEGSDRTQQDADTFYNLLQEIAEQDIATQSHTWRQNDAVVFDNQRLVHGRGLPEQRDLDTSDSERHLLRMWIRRRAEDARAG
jgi:alpha-ketoglutarate-dependent taurine dioxygenase